MAKNKGRRANVEAKKVAQQEAKNKEQINKRAAKEQQPESSGKSKEVLYQVRTKRDSDLIKAYITFTYRAFHPGVTGRLIFFGILIAAPAIIVPQMWLKVLCLTVGCLLILLGLFRQYISLAITKSKDEAYKNGTEFTYDFTMSDIVSYADGKINSVSKYKDIINFFYDDKYFYMGVKSREFFILPKNRFTIGESGEFEDFIYKRSKTTCKWLPDKFSDRMKLRRASRALSIDQAERNNK